MKAQRGFTIVELIVTMAVIAVLFGGLVVALNPGGQIANARNTERLAHVNTILNAIAQRKADYRGNFNCSVGALPTTSTVMASTGGYNIHDCLVPTYTPLLPVDPVSGTYVSASDYNTRYTILQNASSGRVTVTALDPELGKTISQTR